jgi:hypothetical protein
MRLHRSTVTNQETSRGMPKKAMSGRPASFGFTPGMAARTQIDKGAERRLMADLACAARTSLL